jgi:aminotransferase in exopolysaccharide biosynthesis
MNKTNTIIKGFVSFVRDIYPEKTFIALHEPYLNGLEKHYLLEVIESGFVSSVGAQVTQFEQAIAEFAGSRFAVATVNGTAALHAALLVAGVTDGDEVITQALSFVATSNAIKYCRAEPVFIDVDLDTLGMSADKLAEFLSRHVVIRNGQSINKLTGKRIAACLPMHTFGHPCRIETIKELCQQYDIPVIEDAAEALGSVTRQRHCGTLGVMGVFSFNGNKIMTTGGGGMVVTDDESLAKKLKHLTTTAKLNHPWDFVHDEIAYNYRMPNLNAALGLAQLENIGAFLASKRELAHRYHDWCRQNCINFISEPEGGQSNYWLNAILLDNQAQRDQFLQMTNDAGVMTRPVWTLLHHLPMYKQCLKMNLDNSEWLAERLVNIPSSVPGI